MKKQFTILLLALFSVGVIYAQDFSKSMMQKGTQDQLKTIVKKAAKQLKKQIDPNCAEVDPNMEKGPYKPYGNLDFSNFAAKAQLYSNGPITTHVGSGPGGADYSLLEAPNTTWGFGHAIGTGYLISENVLVNATSWTIDSIAFYAYQTGSPTTSTMTDYHLMVYDGDPSNGGTVIWGDTLTNIMSSTEWTGVYRGSDTTNGDRPVYISYLNTSGLVLTTGEYWIAWRCGGSGTSGPWAPPITISGQPATGDALQWDGTAWASIVDGAPQGFPFEVYGTEVASTCPFPTNLSASNVTNITADLSWTENGSASAWDIEFGVSGFTPTGTPTYAGVTANPYGVTGLTASSAYDFYVRANCGGGDLSIWKGPYTFSTLGCDPSSQCLFSMTFDDSAGDGWDGGAAVSVYENSIHIGDYALASGATGTDFIDLCDGATIHLIWIAGTYDDECSFSISDAGGVNITSFADGSVYTTGDTIHTFTVACPTCPMPTALGASNITMTAADLEWTEAGTATTWDIEFGATGFVATGAPTNAGITSNPFNMTGLTASTAYDFYVRANCGGGDYSNWAGPYTFATAGCDVSNQCAYSIDMTDGYGDGWNGAAVSVIQDGIEIANLTVATGTGSTQTIDICDGSSIILMWTSGAYDDECSFQFYDPFGALIIEITDGSTLTNGALITNFTASCTPPSCPAPTTLTASNFTTTSVDLGWTVGGSETEWQIEYGNTGFSQGAGTYQIATTNPYTLTSLTAGTTYDFYVRAVCSASDSSYWEGPYTFSTQCNVFNTYTWYDDFESGGIPCWSVVANNVETWYLDDGTNSTPYSGSYDMVIEYDAALNNQDEFLYSPVFDLTSIGNPEITFFWNMSYDWAVSPNDNYDVYLLATDDGGTTWDTLWTEPTTTFTSWEWYDTTLSLAAYTAITDFQFAFNYVGNDGAACYLDDVKIDFPVSLSNDKAISSNINVYPNPTNGLLNITNISNANVQVYSIIGELLIEESNVNKNVDVSKLPEGNYVIRIITNDKITTKQISLIK